LNIQEFVDINEEIPIPKLVEDNTAPLRIERQDFGKGEMISLN
jgi:hypothetical protein